MLHSFGIAVWAIVGADAGGGEVQGCDGEILLACGEFGAEATTLAAEAGLVAYPDWEALVLEGGDGIGYVFEFLACQSVSTAGVFEVGYVGVLGQGFLSVESL